MSATGGERGSSIRTGSAGISIRVLMASPRSPRRAAGRGRVRAGQAAVPVNVINEPGTSSRAAGLAALCRRDGFVGCRYRDGRGAGGREPAVGGGLLGSDERVRPPPGLVRRSGRAGRRRPV